MTEWGFYCFLQGDYNVKLFFPIESNETVIFIKDGKIYFQAWVEEGWDGEKERATDKYKFYYKRNTLLEEAGNIYQAADGT